MKETLKKRFPFLIKNNNFQFEYDLNSSNKDFNLFFEKVIREEVPNYYKQSKPKK